MKLYMFDLDGTLADSRGGLFPAFRAALREIGVADPGEEVLTAFLGTPLPEMFRALKPGIAECEIERGMQAFRRVYEQVGITGNELYDGVREMLAAVRAAGGDNMIVTSKPQCYAEQVAEFLDLGSVVSSVVGAGLAERDTKTGLIAQALQQADLGADDAIMLGDRHYDIVGAHENGVRAVAALWGYGSPEELREAGAREFAQSPHDFRLHFVVSEPGRTHDRRHRLIGAA